MASDEKYIREVFALVQGQMPHKELLQSKIGQPPIKTLMQAFYSTYVAEKVLLRFVRGGDQPERHEQLGLTDAVARREASRLREKHGGPAAAAEPRPGDPDSGPPPGLVSQMEAELVHATWRHAFHQFFVAMGPHRDKVLGRLARQSDLSASNVAEMAVALDTLGEVDALVWDGRLTEAFLISRRWLEAGCTCFAPRYLAIAARIASEPSRLKVLISAHGQSVSTRLLDQLRQGALARLDALFAGDTDPIVTAFPGELPNHYAFRTVPDGGPFDPYAATRWAALTRPSRLKRDRTRSGTPVVVLPAGGIPAAEVERACAMMVEDGLAVLLVGPGSDDEGERPGVARVESYARARERFSELPGGTPVLVCDTFVAVPGAVFDVMQMAEADAVAVSLELVPMSSGPMAIGAIAGASSRPAGFWAADGAAARALLMRAGERPAQAAPRDKDAAPPLQIYAVEPSDLPTIERRLVDLVIGDEDEALTGAPAEAVVLPADSTAAEVAAALRRTARERALAPDTPVVFRVAGIAYDGPYGRMLAARHAQYGGRSPVAVRGLAVTGDGRLKFDDSEDSAGLLRAAPIGLACLSIEPAVEMLEAQGARRADRIVATFDPVAIAFPDAKRLVKATWSVVLGRLEEDADFVQAVFELGRRDLGAAISRHVGTGAGRGLVPLEGYLRAQETARHRMASIRVDPADSLPILAELLESRVLWSLIADGDGADVYGFLLTVADQPAALLDLAPDEFKALMRLVAGCGAQDAFAAALAPLAPEFCDRNVFFIFPLFDLLSTSLDRATVLAMLFASTSSMAGKPNRLRELGRLGVLIADLCGPDVSVTAWRYLDRMLGPVLDGVPQVIAAFARRILVMDRHVLDPAELRRLVAGLTPDERLSMAVAASDRAAAATALRAIGDRDGHLRSAIEATRLISSEVRRLRLRSADWQYPAYGDPADVLAMAAILGDTQVLASAGGQGTAPEIEAVAAAAQGDHSALSDLFALWANVEGIAPVQFGGTSIAEVFTSIVATVPATSPASPSVGTDGKADLISTVITAYDAPPELLEIAIASILGQSWPEIEIILVDDGSAPERRDAAHAASRVDPRIQFYDMPRNGGPYLARNFALTKAKGALIAIQDVDDVSHPDRFAHQARILAGDPRAWATEAGHMRFSTDGQPQFLRGMKLVDDGPMSTMYRRGAFDRLGPFTATRSRGDVEMRERIRQAFGPAAFVQTTCPLVFCLGAPTTLSLSTVRSHEAALKRFRSAFLSRNWHMGDEGPVPLGTLPVPEALRP